MEIPVFSDPGYGGVSRQVGSEVGNEELRDHGERVERVSTGAVCPRVRVQLRPESTCYPRWRYS